MGTSPCRPSGVRIRAASVQLPRAGAVSLHSRRVDAALGFGDIVRAAKVQHV
jgi:hypothetical protein